MDKMINANSLAEDDPVKNCRRKVIDDHYSN
jgi:hypothetical protein